MNAPISSNRLCIALLLSVAAVGFASCGGGTDGGSGGGSPGSTGGDTLSVGSGSGTGNGAGGAGGACASDTQTAALKPLDIYIMLDQSGSMVGEYDANKYDNCTEAVNADDIIPKTRWKDVTAALDGFVKDGQSSGIHVGLGFFPPKGPQAPGQAKCEDNKCDVEAYASPAVAIEALPGNAGPISTALDFTPCPCNGTPMSAGLQGAVQYAKEQAAKAPDHVVVVLLATDGEPKGDCSGGPDDGKDYPSPVDVAKDALSGSPSIRTYVIGVGELLTSLNAIAAAGGTESAFLVDGDQNTQQAFIDALSEIRGKALSCEVKIPPPPSGQALDPNRVNVEVTESNGTKTTFTRVDSAAGCADAPSSWYYDNAASPTQIILCDDACKKVQGAGEKATLNVAFGCASIVAEPK